MLGGLVTTGVQADLSSFYFVGIASAYSHVLWQIHTMNTNDNENLWRRFNANKYTGGCIALAVVAGHF
jgi:4-hydroxybenzoate polyprenyltransferase